MTDFATEAKKPENSDTSYSKEENFVKQEST